MKLSFIVLFALLLSNFGYSQTTATNFSVQDCIGSSHDLFSELNSGKIVVLCWVMPCGACISPSRTAYDAVQSFATSHPGRVVFYLVDDAADTPCNTLNSWGNNNAMPTAVKFSNAGINLNDYGTAGMPKIVVLGGSAHTIFYNENDGNNTSGIQPAINQALSTSGMEENNTFISDFSIVPTTLKNHLTLNYNLIQTCSLNIEITDITGKIIKSFVFKNQSPGKHERELFFAEHSSGIYFLRLHAGETSKNIKFIFAH